MDLFSQNWPLIPVLTTPRFSLRPYAPEDGEAVVRVLNDWAVTQWLTKVPWPYRPADFDWFLNTFIPDEQHVVWAIDGGAGLIGAVSVDPELGYWLDPAHHGKGIMTEVAMAAIDWHFAQTRDDLTSGYHLGNGPSAAVLHKLGFEDTHINHGVETARGDIVVIQRVALSRADWEAHRG